ncbi:hypothetical protein MSPP1_002987 [Malassezia sp. CBS 17886]|nr:hypothetical protein MSPP1_002987 [Malassezia sp. CBS 17886]
MSTASHYVDAGGVPADDGVLAPSPGGPTAPVSADSGAPPPGHGPGFAPDSDMEKGGGSPGNITEHDNGAGQMEELKRAPTVVRGEDEKDRILVAWEKDDPELARNWSRSYRLYMTFLSGILTLASTFASSAPSFTLPSIMRELHSTELVVKASVFLFVGGYCFAPMIWAPLSDVFGRKVVLAVSMLGFTCFNVGCMLAPNIGALIVFRLLAGAFGSSPLTVAPSVISSLFTLRYLANGIMFFALAPMSGPCLGPIVGGYIEDSGASWRWVFRACTCLSFGLFIICVLTMSETEPNHCLRRKAQRLRKETGDNRYIAPIEMRNLELGPTVKRVLLEPVILFFKEPMLIAVTVYISFVYGTLYLLFDAYPVVFIELHHFSFGSTGLAFLGYFVGSVAGAVYAMFIDNPAYNRAVDKLGKQPPPEIRLRPALLGAPLLVISLFWFAWTSFPSVSFWNPIVAGGLFGMSMYLIFLSLMVYITEVYMFKVASAVAANTVVRSAFGVGFPMFGSQMYHNLNPRWASTVLAFIALVLAPIPLILIKFGPKIRAMSKFAHSEV